MTRKTTRLMQWISRKQRGESGHSGLDPSLGIDDMVPGGTSLRELEDPSTSISAPDVVSRTCLRPALFSVPVPSCSTPALEASRGGIVLLPSSSLPCSRRLRSRPLLLLSLWILDPEMFPDAEGSGEMPDMLQQATQQPWSKSGTRWTMTFSSKINWPDAINFWT